MARVPRRCFGPLTHIGVCDDPPYPFSSEGGPSPGCSASSPVPGYNGIGTVFEPVTAVRPRTLELLVAPLVGADGRSPCGPWGPAREYACGSSGLIPLLRGSETSTGPGDAVRGGPRVDPWEKKKKGSRRGLPLHRAGGRSSGQKLAGLNKPPAPWLQSVRAEVVAAQRATACTWRSPRWTWVRTCTVTPTTNCANRDEPYLPWEGPSPGKRFHDRPCAGPTPSGG